MCLGGARGSAARNKRTGIIIAIIKQKGKKKGEREKRKGKEKRGGERIRRIKGGRAALH